MPASTMHARVSLFHFYLSARARGSTLPGELAEDECDCSKNIYDTDTKRCGESFPWGAVNVVLRSPLLRFVTSRAAH